MRQVLKPLLPPFLPFLGQQLPSFGKFGNSRYPKTVRRPAGLSLNKSWAEVSRPSISRGQSQ